MIRLHHVPFSRSFRALWLMTELGLEFEIAAYDIRDGSMRAPEMLAVSPAGRVPALEIDGISVFESGAILEYLCETRPGRGFGCPPGHPERVRYLEMMHFAETMASQIEQLNLQHLFLRDPKSASATTIKVNVARLRAAMRALEGMLGDREYLLEKGFGAADAMLGFNLFAAPYYAPLDECPKLSAYRERLEKRPGYRAARERDGDQDFYKRDFYSTPDA